MRKLKGKRLLALLLACVFMLSMTGSAFASIDSFIAKDSEEKLYEYDRTELTEAQEEYTVIGESNLWLNWFEKTAIAVRDTINGIVGLNEIRDKQVESVVSGEDFDADVFAQSDRVVKLEVDENAITKVTVDEDGNVVIKPAPVEEKLVVESVSAIDANTISVTFTGEGAPAEAVEITLDTPLVDGQTQVTFTYEEVEYTGTLDEAWVAPVEEGLKVEEVSAINGKVTVEFNKEVTEVPEGLVVLKDDEVLELEEDAFEVVEGKVEVTVPEIEATFEEQSIVYSVQLGEAEAVAADALVIEASDELGVTDVLAEVDEKAKEVTVTATVHNAEEEATATVAIFAYDEEGELVEDAVVPAFEVEIDEEGNIKEEIDVKELESGNYKVVVTVTQVVEEEEVTAKDEFNFELDFKAVDAAVDAVNKADTQIKLKTALENPLFKGFNVDLLAQYDEALKARNFKTITEIQAKIDEVNKKAATATEYETIVEALNGAKNDYEVYLILDEYFENVDEENINEYVGAIFGGDPRKVNTEELDSKAAIQLAIDTVNAEVAVDALFADEDKTALAEGVIQADIDAATALVEILPEDAQEELLESIATAQKLLDDANAAAAVIEMIKALPDADEITNENKDQVKPLVEAAKEAFDELTDDQKSFVEKDVKDKLTAAEAKIDELEKPLIAALQAVNNAANADALKQLIEEKKYGEEGEDAVPYAEILGLDIDKDSDYAKLIPGRDRSVSVDLYNNRKYEKDNKYTLERLQELFNDIVATRLVTQASMDLVNDAETIEDLNGIEYVVILLNRFKETNYKQHSSHQIADRIIYLQGLVDDYNTLSEEYQEEVLQAVIDKRPGDGYARSQATFDPLEAALKIATINYAIESDNAAKLQDLIVENNVVAYINLPRAQRAEVVDYIIATTEKAFDTVEGFKTAVDNAITAYKELLSNVNEATDKTDMVGKLGAIKYDVYDNLTAVQKLDVAEEIFAMVSLEEGSEDEAVEFTTLAEIRAAVDAVIAELGL